MAIKYIIDNANNSLATQSISGTLSVGNLAITGITSSTGLTKYVVVDDDGNTFHQTGGGGTIVSGDPYYLSMFNSGGVGLTSSVSYNYPANYGRTASNGSSNPLPESVTIGGTKIGASSNGPQTVGVIDNATSANGLARYPQLSIIAGTSYPGGYTAGVASIATTVLDGVKNGRAALFYNYNDSIWGLSNTISSGSSDFALFQSTRRMMTIYGSVNGATNSVLFQNGGTHSYTSGSFFNVVGTSSFTGGKLKIGTDSGIQFLGLTSGTSTSTGQAIGVDDLGNIVTVTGGGGSSSGTSGTSGSSGTTGSSGSSGTSGSAGTSGSSGTSGPSSDIITDPNTGISISYGSTNSTIDTIYNTALDSALTMPNTVGGISSGTTAGSLSGLNLVQLFDDLLFPTVSPTYTIPTIGLVSTITGIKEVGETISPAITLTGTENDANYFSQLVIQKSVNGGGASTLLTVSATSSMTVTSASAIASQFGYVDPNNPNYSYAISTTDSGLVVPAPSSGGSSTVAYSGLGNYTAGLAKKNNKGVTHSASAAVRSTSYPQAADTNFASNGQTITGYYPYFYGKTSTQKSASDIVTIIESGTGFTKVVNNGSGSLSMAFSATGEWPWFAVYSVYPTKSTWYENALNNGSIGGVTDLFAAPTTLSVISSDGYWTVTFKIYPANKVTTLGTATIA